MDKNDFPVPFYKMHGSGNDFVLIDNRDLKLPETAMSMWARAICRRSFGVGADGLIFLDNPSLEVQGVDYIWHFFNADGSRPEMCGNGSRCAAWLAHFLGMAPREHVLGTDAGPIAAKVLSELGQVRVQLTPIQDLKTEHEITLENGSTMVLHSANTGVPHAVIITEQADKLDVQSLGSAVRYHPLFAPSGTNANFVEVRDKENIYLRTFERGVEGETYACGTGAAASVAVTHALGATGPAVHVTTSGGEHLEVILDGEEIFLQGNATLVYRGRLSLSALNLD